MSHQKIEPGNLEQNTSDSDFSDCPITIPLLAKTHPTTGQFSNGPLRNTEADDVKVEVRKIRRLKDFQPS